MVSIYAWSKTASENDDADSLINWLEQQDPDTVNNSARGMMQRLAEWREDWSVARTSTGATDVYEITVASSPTALADGMKFSFVPHQSNVGASTLKINTFGAKPLRAKTATNLAEGDVQAGVVAIATYNLSADEFLIENSGHFVHALLPTLLSTYTLNSLMPVGGVMPYPSDSLPAGWLECKGQTLSVASYPELFAKLGYTYGGSGDSFEIPDYRGEFLRGKDSGTGRDPDRNSRTNRGDGTTGNFVGTKQGHKFDEHNHSVSTSVSISSAGNHTHTFSGQLATVDSGSGSTVYGAGGTRTTSSKGAHSHSASASSTAGNKGGNETRGRNVSVIFIIYAKPADALAEMQGLTGLPYVFDSGVTDTDPGGGRLSWNNASAASATELYVSETGPNSEAFGPVLATWDDSGTVSHGTVYITKVGEPTTFSHFTITSNETDQGTYKKWTISHNSSGGTFADGDNVNVLFNAIGADGLAGGNPITSADLTLTINSAEDVTAANQSAALYTLASGLTWCVISRASTSTADVTVICEDSPTKTINGNPDGVVINAVAGPIRFRVDPADADNYITSVPGIAPISQQPWYGSQTVSHLNALTGLTAGAGAFASDGRKNGEGAASGTGVQVFYDSFNWIACDTGATVAA